ncbi:hypothetical protein [Deinococcus cellulosilyticus]|uniref:Uncharacterized protein n=1 Tax=Deinococcus cellulosilyticus (strain DSM 18568 / NBRC 106333 / KACC 11606 / 5516J-15) TaxID=1223518 RepID=A0A511NAQ4_DEIC1|nr:hypothetical protein [Deinococcus cellulosilyticus]GEM49441.1 hypothetical protein DC3_50760 [Deinococcus cellulosilyticus NBRC 106333 = KACC 11606]
MLPSTPSIPTPLQKTQQHLGLYLLLEMQNHGDTLHGLAQDTELCPEILRRLVHGQCSMKAEQALRLAQHWQFSPETLIHWQQDIDSLMASARPVALSV